MIVLDYKRIINENYTIMNGYNLTKVFEINKRLVVADSIEQAIALFHLFTVDDVRDVRQVGSTECMLPNYNAIIAEPVTCSCRQWELTDITFTGVDEQTDINRLVSIQERFPKAEFGVLMSRHWQDNGPRFMSPESIEKLRGRGLRLSAHLCGGFARDVFRMGGLYNIDADFRYLLGFFRRIQLNVSASDVDIVHSGQFMPVTAHEVIIQQGSSHDIFKLCHIACGDTVSILLDQSGGTGKDTPIEVPAYLQHCHVGYAGGIGPDNVIEKLREITASEFTGRFWIDMESGVRTDDRFDLDKVEQVCQQVYDEFCNEKG